MSAINPVTSLLWCISALNHVTFSLWYMCCQPCDFVTLSVVKPETYQHCYLCMCEETKVSVFYINTDFCLRTQTNKKPHTHQQATERARARARKRDHQHSLNVVVLTQNQLTNLRQIPTRNIPRPHKNCSHWSTANHKDRNPKARKKKKTTEKRKKEPER